MPILDSDLFQAVKTSSEKFSFILKTFYCGTIESIISSGITVWGGHCRL